ncbi:MAG TPA: CRISPR-associated protein Csx11 [Cyanobacteria bacterium UBA8803]|nr:CRISPR-associated protein Csx11 [Cyanobacteria bacterium UBA9273]HBL59079.1 CRISPR-associated protein Csx11 [Cyanobacteria bacterium UBA8803]
MTHDLTTLADKRDALLLAEIAAWLHMLGKFHEDFLKGQHDLDIKIPADLTANFAHLDHLLQNKSWSGAIWNGLGIPEFQASSLSVFHFIKEHRNQDEVSEGLLKLMADAHGRGSGIEKGVLNRFAPSQTTTVYSSTTFGTETDAIDLNNLYHERNYFYDFLQTNLELLKNSLGSSAFNLQEFRRKFISNIEDYFRQTVAETRRPLSDVTLFDQTVASVAFLKAALAQNLLVGWKEPPPSDAKTEDKYYWRLLRAGLDGLAFWGDSVRIGDLLARKQLIAEALDTVKKVIEEDYPLGLEVYRDENGSLFMVPDVADLLDAKVDSKNSLREHLQEVANHRFDGEAYWALELSDRTRNTLKFGRLATSQPDKLTANSQSIGLHWNIQEKRDICPVCSLRPIGASDKALKLKVCDICCDRRASRAKKWTQQLKTTIWIDEVADSNSCLALIVGQFDLESWLTGEAFSSIVSSDTISQIWKEPLGSKQHNFDYQQLLSDIQNALKKQDKKKRQFAANTLLDNLVPKKNARGVPKGHNHFQPFYDLQVTETDLGENKLGEKRTTEEPWLLALAMMRQNPSFARLRRAWETTQRFWQKTLTDELDPKLPKVKGRLTIELTNLDRFKLQLFGSYDLVLGMTKLSVLHDNGKLIAIDNLRYAAKQLGAKSEDYASDEAAAEFVRSQLLNQQVPIEEPTGYGSPNKLKGKLNIGNVTFDATEYGPIIPILAEPRTFMALVPADKSLEVIEAIKTKYDREMGKVRNRLPLHLGVVYFQRRTPLRSALDAGRQMLNYKSPTDKQLWEVLKIQCLLTPEKKELADGTQQFKKTITLDLLQDAHKITWNVPVAMGDGKTTDVWYPYVFLKTNDDDNKVTTERQRSLKSQRPGETTPCWLVHAADLKEGDRIYFTPSTFDFEFLDSSARRFEIYYDKNGRRPRQTRPFYLEDLDRFDTLWKILKNLKTSQHHQVIYTIESTREMWYGQNEQGSLTDSVFEQFVTDTLANATWAKDYKKWTNIPQQQRQQLIDAGVRGELADLAELHMEILKDQ